MKLFFEKYPVLIDPSLCWDFFWKSILVCGVRTSTEGHVLHGVRFLTPNRRQRTRRQKLELLQWIVALRWGGWDVSPEKRTISKGKANVFLHQPFSAKMWVFFGRLSHWPVECNFLLKSTVYIRNHLCTFLGLVGWQAWMSSVKDDAEICRTMFLSLLQ